VKISEFTLCKQDPRPTANRRAEERSSANCSEGVSIYERCNDRNFWHREKNRNVVHCSQALMILAGLLAIFIPPVAGLAVTIFVDWLLIFSGVTHLVFAWQTRTSGALVFELLLGVLYLVVGGIPWLV
jgi:uncharacterized membrane protein HdeD (DUF308 family)